MWIKAQKLREKSLRKFRGIEIDFEIGKHSLAVQNVMSASIERRKNREIREITLSC